MTSLKDLGKLVNGLSLVAKEAMKRSHLDKPDFQSLIQGAILSATDLSGLTKGEVRKFKLTALNSDEDTKSRRDGSSVVYFGEEEASLHTPAPSSSSDNIPSPPTSDQSTPRDAKFYSQSPFSSPTIIHNNDTVVPPATLDGNAADPIVEEEKAVPRAESSPNETPLIKKHRRRKERKVPSSSFSRALGLVF